MTRTQWRRGTPIDDATLSRLRELIKQHGIEGTSELLGIGRDSIKAAAAGGGVRDVTAIAIRAKLDEVEKKKTA